MGFCDSPTSSVARGGHLVGHQLPAGSALADWLAAISLLGGLPAGHAGDRDESPCSVRTSLRTGRRCADSIAAHAPFALVVGGQRRRIGSSRTGPPCEAGKAPTISISCSVRWLWWLHSVHHRATEVRWWTAFRAHPLSGFVVHLLPFSAVAAAGLGSDPPRGALRRAMVIVVSVVAHADVESSCPPIAARLLVVMPTFHRCHHERGGGRGALRRRCCCGWTSSSTCWTGLVDDRQPDGLQRGEVGAARRYGSDERIAIAVPHDRPLGDDHA